MVSGPPEGSAGFRGLLDEAWRHGYCVIVRKDEAYGKVIARAYATGIAGGFESDLTETAPTELEALEAVVRRIRAAAASVAAGQRETAPAERNGDTARQHSEAVTQ